MTKRKSATGKAAIRQHKVNNFTRLEGERLEMRKRLDCQLELAQRRAEPLSDFLVEPVRNQSFDVDEGNIFPLDYDYLSEDYSDSDELNLLVDPEMIQVRRQNEPKQSKGIFKPN